MVAGRVPACCPWSSTTITTVLATIITTTVVTASITPSQETHQHVRVHHGHHDHPAHGTHLVQQGDGNRYGITGDDVRDLAAGVAVNVAADWVGSKLAPAKLAAMNVSEEVNCSISKCRGRGYCATAGNRTGCVCKAGLAGKDCRRYMGCSDLDRCSGNGRCFLDGYGSNGTCVCSPGWTGRRCRVRKPQHCPAGCSGHGKCIWNRFELTYSCACHPGFTGELCNKYTGPYCDNHCSGAGTCKLEGEYARSEVNRSKAGTVCDCMDGAEGDDCSTYTNVCPFSCGRGSCVNGTCVCAAGFTGQSCDQYMGFQLCANLNYCSGFGVCTTNTDIMGNHAAQCTCFEGYGGDMCEIADVEDMCPNYCNGNGKCEIKPEPHCVCKRGWAGPACSRPLCPYSNATKELCSGHGLCEPMFNNENHTCVCDDYWLSGPRRNCDQPMCPNACSGNGKCHLSACICNDGFTGEDCSVKISTKTTIIETNSALEPQNANAPTVMVQGWTDITAPSAQSKCVHGDLNAKGKCECREGYVGLDCATFALVSKEDVEAFEDIDV